ncbi:MAG: FAD/NAD(P)-binding protein [Aquamicrobium sp.]|uniref:FAD/NAD(P)-binding protein n=1 Tax=Aquamicrobium sp. TaxID=1872579 RepID=UPI00349EB333|nr:FAD/NAD(P)-binding protein [Aquamicrobium sp.]
MRGERTIVIIGGGASGVLLAAQLLKAENPALRVVIVEKTGVFGRGLAYSATLDEHLLNVGAHGMSAFPDAPDHFRIWLGTRGIAVAADSLHFAPGRLYGDYLGEISAGLAAREPERLRLMQADVVSVSPHAAGVAVRLADGTVLQADAAVLAVGHDAEPAGIALHAMKPGAPGDTPLAPDAPVLILGSGLSMIDAWLSLKARGHRGPVTVLSRRGLMPRAHLARKPIPIDIADVPLGAPPARFMHWLRRLVRAHEAAGGHWQNVIDGLRPFNQRIWQAWSDDERGRFLRHAKAWWDVHRHRAAPQIAARLAAAVGEGGLTPLAGKVGTVERADDGLLVTLRLRGAAAAQTLAVARIYDCTGVVRDVASGSLAAVRSLTDRGLARPDPLRLGLDVTEDCAVIDAAGNPSGRVFAIGPLTRGALFEIEAVPDIRVQAAKLARTLI